MTDESYDARGGFRRALDDLDDQLVRGALEVAEAIPEVSSRYLGGDATAISMGAKLDRSVSSRCRDVEQEAFVLIAREAPVGADLRRIVALLRLVTDVDRAASLLRHVPETLDMADPRALPTPIRATLERLADGAADVYRRGVDSWRLRDGLAVNEVEPLDETVDDAQRDLLERISTADVKPEVHLAMGLVGRYYERIADHGVMFARDAAFVVTGQRIAP